MKPVSSTAAILSSSVALGVVVLATRAVAGAKDIVISRVFGTSPELDAFLVAFGIMGFLAAAISNASQATLVPALSRAHNDPDPQAEPRLIVVAAATAISLGSVVAGIAVLFRVPLSRWVAPGFDADRAVAVQGLLLTLAPVPVLAPLQAIVSSTLNARFGFRKAAAITALTPLTITAAFVLRQRCNATDLAWATMVGLSLEILCLVGLARLRRIVLVAAVPWSRLLQSASGLARDFLPLVAGSALSSTSPLVDQAFASMAGPGAVSALNYANRLTTLAMGVGISSLGLLVLPHFSALAARGAWDEMAALLRKLAWSTFLLAIPATIALAGLSRPLLCLLFQHGQFLASDTAKIAPMQTMYALQLPFHLTVAVAVRALHAMRQNRTIMLLSGANVISNITGDYVFMKLLGLRGIALATSTMHMVSCLAMLLVAQMELRRRAGAR